MSEWFIGLGYEGQLATWLVASFLLYVLSSQLAWQFQWFYPGGPFSADALSQSLTTGAELEPNGGVGHIVYRLRSYRFAPWVEEMLRFAYYLGIPFLAAINGLLPADLLGISGSDWGDGQGIQGFLWEDWTRGLGLAVVAILAAMAIWLTARLISRRAGLVLMTRGLPGPLWQRLLRICYDQIHWAFYRSGPILWLNDLYWGTFVGLALILIEAAVNPALRWALKSPETAGPPLFRLGMAWISALLFLATQNLWLTISVHLVLAALLGEKPEEGYLGVYESPQ